MPGRPRPTPRPPRPTRTGRAGLAAPARAPATPLDLDALAAAYTTGSATLLDWVDVTRSVLDLELEAVELRGDLERGIASLERAVGGPLPRTPVREDSGS